jgi:hypothetical protein
VDVFAYNAFDSAALARLLPETASIQLYRARDFADSDNPDFIFQAVMDSCAVVQPPRPTGFWDGPSRWSLAFDGALTGERARFTR